MHLESGRSTHVAHVRVSYAKTVSKQHCLTIPRVRAVRHPVRGAVRGDGRHQGTV